MRVQRLLSTMMILMMTIMSATSVAAAMCAHRSAHEHAAALTSSEAGTSVAAHLEEAAGAVAGKRGVAADSGSFSLSAFILPVAAIALPEPGHRTLPPRAPDAAKVPPRSRPPLLEPPTA